MQSDSTRVAAIYYDLQLLMPILEEIDKNSEAMVTCQHTQRFLRILDVVCENPNQELISKLIMQGEMIGFFPKKSFKWESFPNEKSHHF
ncbi:hypothetical protein [Bacillus toyonensis]|uniref:hypothetical protein n=1 Tax=Bacillus toyonensis TaxID=155322 RepID=UPI000BFB47A4|nr:hypothetical protein [Bacillus toyonensis]PHG57736.1 hypothetical protein COI59_29135 [Bacillus toyonensis]